MVNGTLLNVGKRYEDNLRVIVDQRPKIHLGLDALGNQKNLKRFLIAISLWRQRQSSCKNDHLLEQQQLQLQQSGVILPYIIAVEVHST